MNNNLSPVHVAVGVIKIDAEHVLISKRHEHLHQGGLWEFPGGKVHRDESVSQALSRELHEELGILVTKTEPLIQIPYDYGDKLVVLDVHLVTSYQGAPVGREGQELKTVPLASLQDFDFPAANKGILAAIQLPRACMITGQYATLPALHTHLEQAIESGIRFIQFRAHDLNSDVYRAWASSLGHRCKERNVTLVLNTSLQNYEQGIADGLHLSSQRLMACQQRPIATSSWLGASVHNEQELAQAVAIEADYVFIAPVKTTSSHPNAVPLGWDGFRALVTQASMPVYALGGMTHDDMDVAIGSGAQGIAGINLFQ